MTLIYELHRFGANRFRKFSSEAEARTYLATCNAGLRSNLWAMRRVRNGNATIQVRPPTLQQRRAGVMNR